MKQAERHVLKQVSIHAELNQLQERGAIHIRNQKRVVLGDPTGMGKCKQFMLGTAHLEQIVIVCKKRMKPTMEKQIHLWVGLDEKVLIVNRPGQVERIANFKWIIMDYDQIHLDPKKHHKIATGELVPNPQYGKPTSKAGKWIFTYFIQNGWPPAVIFDEIHKAANTKAGFYLGAKALSLRAQYCIPVTASLQMNRVDDLWVSLSLIEPKIFKSRWDFLKKHANARPSRFGWLYDKRAADTPALVAEVGPYIIRRPKVRDGWEKLPPETVYIAPDLEQRLLMDRLEREILIETSPDNFMLMINSLVKFTRLRQVAISPKLIDYNLDPGPKLEEVAQYIEECQFEKEKILVGSCFRQALVILGGMLKDRKVPFVMMVGGQSEKEMIEVEREFQENPKCIACLATLGLDGVTLTAAHRVAYLDKHMNPAINVQFEDRLDRPGQTENIEITEFMTANSADQIVGIMASDKFIASEDLYRVLEEFHFNRLPFLKQEEPEEDMIY